jgi:hypothetical protein
LRLTLDNLPFHLSVGKFQQIREHTACKDGESIQMNKLYEKLDGPTVSALRHAIVEVKQRWSVMGWVIKNLLSRAPVLRKPHYAISPGCICSR